MEAKIIVHPASIKALVEASWEFSYNLLWKRFLLDEDEIGFLKQVIADYYWSIPPMEFSQMSKLYFERFCARITSQSEKTSRTYLLPTIEIIEAFECQIAVN